MKQNRTTQHEKDLDPFTFLLLFILGLIILGWVQQLGNTTIGY